MNADRFVPEERWKVITELKRDPKLAELDELVNATVPKKALSMGTNKMIFNHVLLVSERDQWRSGMARVHPIGKVTLTKGFLSIFQAAAVDRIRLALHESGRREILRVDANGKAAQQKAMKMRGLVGRIAPRWRADEKEAAAATFLEGMQSPPP